MYITRIDTIIFQAYWMFASMALTVMVDIWSLTQVDKMILLHNKNKNKISLIDICHTVCEHRVSFCFCLFVY